MSQHILFIRKQLLATFTIVYIGVCPYFQDGGSKMEVAPRRTQKFKMVSLFFGEGWLPSVVVIAIFNSSMVQNHEPIEEEESWLYVRY